MNPAREDLRQRLAELRGSAHHPPTDIVERFTEIEDRFAALGLPVYARLLESPLAWTQEDHDDGAWVFRTSRELGLLGLRIWEALSSDPGDSRARHMVVRTLLHLGDSVKWQSVVSWDSPADYRKTHALMHFAMNAGFHREPVRLVLPERIVECNVEALYFRALLLARFSGGAFELKQLEILDQWMWLWIPVLQGTTEMPLGGAFRADLDSNDGLRPGKRHDFGSSLYLPVAPILKAYVEIVKEFHAGRIVPANGIASRFRIEEHVAVLEIARRGLRGIAAAPLGRAEREACDTPAELIVGLGQLVREGFAAPEPPPRRTSLTLATVDGNSLARDPRASVDASYERPRRDVRIVNASQSGFGIEAESAQLHAVRVGDLVALRIAPSPAPEICKVSRYTPVPGSTVVRLGLMRLSSDASLVEFCSPAGSPARDRIDRAIFVPGRDSSGRHDAWLVSEREFAGRPVFEVLANNRFFAMKLDRVRDRGNGWVLAGFQVLAEKAA